MKHLMLILLSVSMLWLSSCKEESKLINGDQAPDFTMQDTEGNDVSLSSLKGKIVLIDFWASWCKPCREQNPELRKLYNKYRDVKFKEADQFIILSVSLDSDKEKWLTAIANDQLDWPYHISELTGWNTGVVEAYGFNSIPTQMLIDQHGIVIGKNNRIHEIENILDQRMIDY